MKIVARVASLVTLAALAELVMALWSSAADGERARRMPRVDGTHEAVVDTHGNLRVPPSYREAFYTVGYPPLKQER